MLREGRQGRSEHGALQHRRDPGAARSAAERADRQPAAHLRGHRRPATIAGLVAGRQSRSRDADSRAMTNQCHDITVFPEVGLAAGACSGNGILLDIYDPEQPDAASITVSDKNFAYWHSATFNNDGTKVLFTDEWGGGTRPRCRATDPLELGRRRDLRHRRSASCVFKGYYKMPAPQTEHGELRRAQRLADPGARARHHGAGVVSGRRRRCSTSPTRRSRSRSRSSIAGRSTRSSMIIGGFWSTYWYNGRIYGSETRARHRRLQAARRASILSQNEIDAATLIRNEELNTQEQKKITWPARCTPAALSSSISSRAPGRFRPIARRR